MNNRLNGGGDDDDGVLVEVADRWCSVGVRNAVGGPDINEMGAGANADTFVNVDIIVAYVTKRLIRDGVPVAAIFIVYF